MSTMGGFRYGTTIIINNGACGGVLVVVIDMEYKVVGNEALIDKL